MACQKGEDLSSPDAEMIAPGLIGRGIDLVDWWAALAPKPCLLMAGRLDEVFTESRVRAVARELERIYGLLGAAARFALFIDETPHIYSFQMAVRCVSFMDRWLRSLPPRELALTEEEVSLEPKEALTCFPNAGANMFSLNRRRAEQLGERREPIAADKVRQLLGLDRERTWKAQAQVLERTERWQHVLEKLVIMSEPDVLVPALLLRRMGSAQPAPALLYIDEAGKWQPLRHGGLLAKAAGFLQDEAQPGEMTVLSADVRGLGETKPQPSEYDLAPWCDIERALPALAIGMGYPLLGMRTLDAEKAS
ncbi:MAG: hypothetical protein ACUVWR_11010 [Anaerolineae bacterium]